MIIIIYLHHINDEDGLTTVYIACEFPLRGQ